METKGMLYFVNYSANKRQEVCVCRNTNECLTEIGKFLKEHPKFKWYYTRIYIRDGITKFDIGSHTDFFEWEGEDHGIR